VASPSSPGEIRTFLIADVRGYTLFTQERGDEAALDLNDRADITGGIAAFLQALASVEAAEGRHERAMHLFGAGQAVSESVGGGDATLPLEAWS
jgi:hypothetical protein